MKTGSYWSILTVLVSLALASSGCNTVLGPNLPPSSEGGFGAAQAGARVMISMPRSRGIINGLNRPDYISPATQSITVQVDSTTPVTQNLTPRSSTCRVPAPLDPLTCTIYIAATSGKHRFTFTAYDQPKARGNELSINSVMQTLIAGQVNRISVTLAGIPNTIQIVGTPGSTTIVGNETVGLQFVWGIPQDILVTALDADGNYIVGPGSPKLTVTVSEVTPGAGITVIGQGKGSSNDFVVHSAGFGTARLVVKADPAANLAGAPLLLKTGLTATTMTSTTAGNGVTGFHNGQGADALFNVPTGITLNTRDRKLYVSDTYNCAVRASTTGGLVTTIAGSATCGFHDGRGSNAMFNLPRGVAYDTKDGNLYVTDYFNCVVRRVTAAGVVSTIAGLLPSPGPITGPSPTCGFADGKGSAVRFYLPNAITYDPADDDLYVADTNNCIIRRVTTDGVVTTIAGIQPPIGAPVPGRNYGPPKNCGFADGVGNATRFYSPSGIAYDEANRNLYVGDYNNCILRQVTTAGIVSTLAGNKPPVGRPRNNGNSANCGIADGKGSVARFFAPTNITYDSGNGDLYVTDTLNCVIRQVTTTGVVSTVAGAQIPPTPPPGGGKTFPTCGFLDGIGTAANFSNPDGLVYDAATERLFITDKFNNAIRQVQL